MCFWGATINIVPYWENMWRHNRFDVQFSVLLYIWYDQIYQVTEGVIHVEHSYVWTSSMFHPMLFPGIWMNQHSWCSNIDVRFKIISQYTCNWHQPGTLNNAEIHCYNFSLIFSLQPTDCLTYSNQMHIDRYQKEDLDIAHRESHVIGVKVEYNVMGEVL